jgi:hypothetical protein
MDGLARVLDAEQFKALKAWQIDPSGVDFKDSPFRRDLYDPLGEMRKRRQAETQGSAG